jgi:hypothetical protein
MSEAEVCSFQCLKSYTLGQNCRKTVGEGREIQIQTSSGHKKLLSFVSFHFRLPKLLPPEVLFYAQNAPKPALRPDPLGELTALPQTLYLH